jgi:DNA-binding response OmpR family regulator
MVHVLVIENDMSIGSLTCQSLRCLGHAAVWASTCDAARHYLTHYAEKRKPSPFDVILLDYWMDEGQCASGLLPVIEDLSRVVLFTAVPHPVRLANSLGIDYVLPKPFDFEELEHAIQLVADRRKVS